MAIKLRVNFGSFRPVVKVYAYDPCNGVALVKTHNAQYGEMPALESLTILELQAIDDDGVFHDVRDQLRARACEVVNDQLISRTRTST